MGNKTSKWYEFSCQIIKQGSKAPRVAIFSADAYDIDELSTCIDVNVDVIMSFLIVITVDVGGISLLIDVTTIDIESFIVISDINEMSCISDSVSIMVGITMEVESNDGI